LCTFAEGVDAQKVQFLDAQIAQVVQVVQVARGAVRNCLHATVRG